MRKRAVRFLVGNQLKKFEHIDFGDEGQGYKSVSFEEFLTPEEIQ